MDGENTNKRRNKTKSPNKQEKATKHIGSAHCGEGGTRHWWEVPPRDV